MKDKRLKSDKLRFSKISQFVKGDSILDIGASEGNVHNMLKSKFKDKQVFSMDSVGKPDFKVNLDNPKKINKKFDTVIGGEILEHVICPMKFLKYCKDLLKKEGILIITTPNAIGIQYIKNPSWCVNYEDYRGHSQAFTLPMLEKNLKELGFKIIHMEYINAFWIKNPLEYFSLIFKRFRPDLMIVAEKLVY
ncbi:MAG: class I SAM-dependent methyltransferase [Candidatus Pacearchaeota archaeon]|nr:class I SAM-dependent methyltransferase [Candidatus Pacearchaeota archaeon]